MQAVEHLEDDLFVLRVNADSVIAHREHPGIAFSVADTWISGVEFLRRYLMALLIRFCRNVLDPGIGDQHRKSVMRDFRSALFNSRAQELMASPRIAPTSSILTSLPA